MAPGDLTTACTCGGATHGTYGCPVQATTFSGTQLTTPRLALVFTPGAPADPPSKPDWKDGLIGAGVLRRTRGGFVAWRERRR